jgi:hypothetical protein
LHFGVVSLQEEYLYFEKSAIMQLKDELEQRGFIKQYTDEKLFEIYEKG